MAVIRYGWSPSYRPGQIYFNTPNFQSAQVKLVTHKAGVQNQCVSDREMTRNIAFCSLLPK